MVRVGARVLLLLLVASWLAPAVLALQIPPEHSCCRRAGHHCPQSAEQAFRDSTLHCHSCQGLVTAHQAPRVATTAVGIAPRNEYALVHEFSPAVSPEAETAATSERGPPALSCR